MQKLYMAAESDAYFRSIDVYRLDEEGDVTVRGFTRPIAQAFSIAEMAAASELALEAPEMFEPDDLLVRARLEEQLTLERGGRGMHIVGRALVKRFVVSQVTSEGALLSSVERVLQDPRQLMPPLLKSALVLGPADQLDEFGFRELRRAATQAY